MQPHLVKISSLSFIFGLLTLAAQFGLLYLLDNPLPSLAVSIILVPLVCYFILESSFTFSACFSFILLLNIGSLLITAASAFEMFGTHFAFSLSMAVLCMLNWLLPFAFLTLRYIMDSGPRFQSYCLYFVQMTVLFWLVFAALFGYRIFYQQISFPYLPDMTEINFIPFMTIASFIEARIYDGLSLRPVIQYALQYLLLFIPFGFFLHALFRRGFLLLRLFLYLLIPFAIELIQYFIFPKLCDMDDLILGFLGALTGSLLYTILNRICLAVSDEPFLDKRSRTTMYHLWKF